LSTGIEGIPDWFEHQITGHTLCGVVKKSLL